MHHLLSLAVVGICVVAVPARSWAQQVKQVPVEKPIAVALDLLFATTKLVPEEQIKLVAIIAPEVRPMLKIIDLAKKQITLAMILHGIVPTSVRSEAEIKVSEKVTFWMVRTRAVGLKDGVVIEVEHWFCARVEQTLLGEKKNFYQKVEAGIAALPKFGLGWQEIKEVKNAP